jgi:CRP-like cAMP-binding protein
MIRTSEEQCALLKKRLRFFHFLDENALAAVADYFSCRQFRAGETLWKEGDEGDFEAFIVEGRVEVKKETEFPGKQVVVGVYSAGTIVGELCVVDQRPRAVTAVALEDTAILTLSCSQLEKLLERNPEVGIRLLKGILLAVSTRLRKSFERLAAIF